MWFGTQGGGLCRFDGTVYQTFTSEHGLPSNYVNAIFEDRDRRLWVGTNAGICFLKGKSFEKIPAVESRGFQVLSICQHQDGQIWLGTDRGLYTCDPRGQNHQKTEPVAVSGKRLHLDDAAHGARHLDRHRLRRFSRG